MNEPINNTIPSVDFGAFAPQPSAPLATKDGELLAMAAGVIQGVWQIPQEVFTELPKRLSELAMGKNPRTAVKAARLLIQMNAANGPDGLIEHHDALVIYLPDNGRGGEVVSDA